MSVVRNEVTTSHGGSRVVAYDDDGDQLTVDVREGGTLDFRTVNRDEIGGGGQWVCLEFAETEQLLAAILELMRARRGL